MSKTNSKATETAKHLETWYGALAHVARLEAEGTITQDAAREASARCMMWINDLNNA